MNLQKAIEILQDLLGEGPQYPPDDRRDAVNLGIEAIKREQETRLEEPDYPFPLLPGETKD